MTFWVLLQIRDNSLNIQRCNFSLVARYSLEFTLYSLLVVKLLVTHCRTCLLLVLNSHVICYLWQKSLVAKYNSLLVRKFTCYSLQKLLVAKNHLLLDAKFACCSLHNLFVAENHSLLAAKFAPYSL